MTAKEETYGEAERLADEFRKLFYADRLDDPALDLAIVLSKAAGVVVGRLRQSRYEGGSLIAGGYPVYSRFAQICAAHAFYGSRTNWAT